MKIIGVFVFVSVSAALFILNGCNSIESNYASSMNVKKWELAPGGDSFEIILPSSFEVMGERRSSDIDSCSYVIFRRRPFASSRLQEPVYGNYIFIKHFTRAQYEEMYRREGRSHFSDAYAFTLNRFHDSLKRYETDEEGIVFRRDVRASEGVFCLAGIVRPTADQDVNWSEDEDLLTDALLSFKVAGDQDSSDVSR